ncbi:MAG: TatD family hydrolase [Candidatus Competibacteraceae bacterium]
MALNFLISLSGIVTFKNATQYAVARRLPADRLLVETDSPYLAPNPIGAKKSTRLGTSCRGMRRSPTRRDVDHVSRRLQPIIFGYSVNRDCLGFTRIHPPMSAQPA